MATKFSLPTHTGTYTYAQLLRLSLGSTNNFICSCIKTYLWQTSIKDAGPPKAEQEIHPLVTGLVTESITRAYVRVQYSYPRVVSEIYRHKTKLEHKSRHHKLHTCNCAIQNDIMQIERPLICVGSLLLAVTHAHVH